MIKPPKSEEEVIIWRDLISKSIDDGGGGVDPDDFVKRVGDTMLGQLKGIAPVAGDDLTRKDYIDTNFASKTSNVTQQFNGHIRVGGGVASGAEGGQIYFAPSPDSGQENPSIDTVGTAGGNQTFRMIQRDHGGSQKVITFPAKSGEVALLSDIKQEQIFASAVFNRDAIISRSFNVAGVVDNGTGSWTVNFASAAGNSPICSATAYHGEERFGNLKDVTVNHARVQCYRAADNSYLEDPDFMHIIAID